MDAVRILVPYFIFGDREPFIGCIEELDKAFNWAEKYGLQILIDLHTAPDSQNGFDNGGISGVCKWSQEPDEVEFELTVLERLAERYGTRKGLWGIEILNEPILEDMWESMKDTERYPAVDPEKAKGTKLNTMEFIRGFYLEAYDRIRKHMSEDKYVVFHDAFCLKAWKDFMREDKYKNVVLDIHQYLMVAEMKGCQQTVEEYVKYVKELKKDIAEMQEYFPVICMAFFSVDKYYADILNMSWTLNRDSNLLHEAIQYASENGVLILAAAGNLSFQTPSGSQVYPAAWEEVIGVAGADLDENGNSISSLWYIGGEAVYVSANGSYEDQKGSSYAVPRVSAAVAGYLLENPGVTQEKVLDYLKNKAVDAGDKGYDLQFGWGYIE